MVRERDRQRQGKGGGNGERERDRERQRQRDKERDRQTERQREGTFWMSSGVSVVMLRICWASCRFMPVMLEVAADCCPALPRASAAA